ncbi:MAG: transmembrane sensor [Paraglaciecola sp.]|jgi:transmembrane sensor
MTNDELLHKWVNRTISSKELVIFNQRPEYQELTELYRQTEHLAAPTFNKKKVLQNILAQDKSPLRVQREAKTVSFASYFKYAVAASLVLFAGWFYFNLDSTTTVLTAASEQKNGALPDQSTYVLNANSELAFSEKTWSENRVLELVGEAFFRVQKGKKFQVKTGNGSVQVLGTQFNVFARGDILEVTCKEGKVSILASNGNTLKELLPNEAVRIKKDKILDTWTTEAKDVASWTTGISKFRKVTIATILAELERQFDIKIIANDIDKTQVITCNFQHENLELALKTALTAAGIKYRIAGKEVFLSE